MDASKPIADEIEIGSFFRKHLTEYQEACAALADRLRAYPNLSTISEDVFEQFCNHHMQRELHERGVPERARFWITADHISRLFVNVHPAGHA